MDRKEFLKICGFSCLGVLGLSGMMQSCGTTHYAVSDVQGNRLVVSKKSLRL